MADKCGCGASLALHERHCSVCQDDNGFPNVRYAGREEELRALADRLAEAEQAAAAQNALPNLLQFGDAVESSEAVCNRWIGPLHTWIKGANPRFATFYHDVEHGRTFNEDAFNRQRASAENTVNPWFYQDLSIAALTLDGTGLSYYGHYAVILKDAAIGKRATVFEENPFYFLERHLVIAGKDPPAGYRAVWVGRGDLAKAKLHSRVHHDTSPEGFPAILMGANRDEADCDFMEVHIYEDLHRDVIARILGPVPVNEDDQELWSSVKRAMKASGAEVVEV